ncbi:UbiA family prenyltransferase [Mongoliimonas terrestris]|uniref:UbiA family prenyltransferase n=1 Tax=Mongoliimonas terrestris TaxID=1709001 RepID=UPI000ADA0853|nr:UbiA family prenyltransferase [Mongoliimonas terrestris]
MSADIHKSGNVEILKSPGRFKDYLAIARFDHSTKHIFIVPGIVLAYHLRGVHTETPAISLALGLAAAVCIASANYVINEWLDRDFDKHHPTKSSRSAVQRDLRGGYVFLEWFLFALVGLACAFTASTTMFAIACVFALQGLVYNVPPIRTKDKAYLDVISESVNNPLRLMIGWEAIDPTTLPPSSIILAYWLGGAFLMGAKRLSEYREIVAAHGKLLLARYRASFAAYTEVSLTVSCFVYALMSTFFLAIFMIKYRIEYILAAPVVTALFAQYLAMAMRPGSAAQKPEKLYAERGLILLVALLALTFVLTTAVDMPMLDAFTGQQFIRLF